MNENFLFLIDFLWIFSITNNSNICSDIGFVPIRWRVIMLSQFTDAYMRH